MVTNQRVVLGAGFFAIFFTSHGIGALAIPYYQMTLGVDPFYLGIVLTLPVLLSALISPWAGTMIERYQTNGFRRKLFILVSAWLCAFSFGSIWMAPLSWNSDLIVLYLLLSSAVFFVAATFLTISVRCLAYEASSDSRELTHVMGYTTVFEKLGSIFYYWMFPIAQWSLFQNVHQGIRYIGWLVAIGLIGCLASIAGLFGRAPLNQTAPHRDRTQPESDGAKPAIRPLLPMYQRQLNLLLALVALQFGVIGLCVSMDFYVLVYYVGAGDIASGATWKGVLSTAYALIGLLTIPVLVKASDRFGKKRTLAAVYLISAFGGAAKWFIYTPGNEYWLVLDAFLGAWIWTAMSTIVPSLLADLCYLNRQKTGEFHDGVVVARHNWAMNLSLVFAFLLSGLVLKAIGFDSADRGDQPEGTLYFMRALLSAGSVIFSLLPLWIIRHIDVTRTEAPAEHAMRI